MSYEDFREWRTTPLRRYPELSIVIPAYNEEERILPTIGAIASHVCDLGIAWELIVADDGSTDRTVDLLRAAEWVNMRVLPAPANAGKGDAVRRGMLAAEGRYVLFADADQSTPIEELDRMLAAVRNGADVAIGSRAAEGATESNRSRFRQLASDVLRLMVRVLLRVGVRDTQCGFKLFTHQAARDLFRRQTIAGFSFDLEILYLAARGKLRIDEVPVQWIDAPGSKVDVKKEAARFVTDIARIRTNAIRGVYADAA